MKCVPHTRFLKMRADTYVHLPERIRNHVRHGSCKTARVCAWHTPNTLPFRAHSTCTSVTNGVVQRSTRCRERVSSTSSGQHVTDSFTGLDAILSIHGDELRHAVDGRASRTRRLGSARAWCGSGCWHESGRTRPIPPDPSNLVRNDHHSLRTNPMDVVRSPAPWACERGHRIAPDA